MLEVLLALALAVQSPAQQDTAAFENIAFQLPAGWTRAVRNSDLFLKPGDLAAGQSFVVAVMHEGDSLPGTLTDGLDSAWQAFATGDATISNRSPATAIKTARGEAGLSSSGILAARGTRLYITIAVFKPRDRYRVFASLATNEVSNTKYAGAFGAMLKSVEFRKAFVAADAVSPAYELLLTFASGLSASPTGGSDYGGGTYVYCVFAGGSWTSTAPNRGLNGYDLAAEQGKHSADFGTWQRTDGVLALRTPYKVEHLYPQSDGSYLRKDKEAREATYFKIPTSTGRRFAGRYIKQGQSDGPQTASITFRADGTFQDNGVVHMVLPDETGVTYRDISEVLGPGAGKYEIANNTLTLSYSDGRRKPMLFILTPKLASKQDPDAIYLAKVWLKKS